MPVPLKLTAGDRLPVVELSSASGGPPRPLVTHSRDALVLLLLPRGSGAYDDYLQRLAGAAAELEEWYAELLVVVHGEGGEAERWEGPGGRLTVLADPEGAAARRIGVGAGEAALVIADRYGQIYEVTRAGHPQELPSPAQIEEWVKFLATQCPECGVIDEPGHGEWALT